MNGDAISCVKLVEGVHVIDDEIHAGARNHGRARPKVHRDLAEVHASGARWIAPAEPELKPELLGVEGDRRAEVPNGEDWMELRTVDGRLGRWSHGALESIPPCATRSRPV
jgi:hypothetical protein